MAQPLPTPDFQALFESAPGLYLVLTPATIVKAGVRTRYNPGADSNRA